MRTSFEHLIAELTCNAPLESVLVVIVYSAQNTNNRQYSH